MGQTDVPPHVHVIHQSHPLGASSSASQPNQQPELEDLLKLSRILLPLRIRCGGQLLGIQTTDALQICQTGTARVTKFARLNIRVLERKESHPLSLSLRVRSDSSAPPLRATYLAAAVDADAAAAAETVPAVATWQGR